MRLDGAAGMREWTIEGSGGRVTIRLAPPAHTDGGGARPSDRMPVEFSAELSGPGYFRGTSTVHLAALDLVRFHRELGGVVAGLRRHATPARLSGFIGAGLSGAVSFNDIAVGRSSLVRSYAALRALADDVAAHAVITAPPEPEPPALRPPRTRVPGRRRSAH